MHPSHKEPIARIRNDWYAACHRRGLVRPNAANLTPMLAGLDLSQLQALEATLSRSVSGAEQGGDFALLNWAAKCTLPTVLALLSEAGLACSGTNLYLAGLALMELGWDMSARLVTLKDRPDDIEALRGALAQHPGGREDIAPASSAPPADQGTEAARTPLVEAPRLAQNPSDEDFGPGQTGQHGEDDDSRAEAPHSPDNRLRLKLYGKSAAHTVEIGPHRRGGDFLGTHVVTFESARALPNSGYDWGRKLTFQLTPEEMPAAIAVLMNIQPSVRFEYHGKTRDKFLELRWQGSGLAVTTGQKSQACVVPVQSSAVYYLLSLFCRAMVHGQHGVTTADVLAMVGALPGADPNLRRT